MKRSRRQRAASKAAFALAAKLTPEQRKYRAQRAALARYDRPAFEALRAHEAERQVLTEPELAAIEIVKQALREHWRQLPDEAELALREALRLGATPCLPRPVDRLHVYRPERVPPALWHTLKEYEREIVAVLAQCPPPPLPERCENALTSAAVKNP